MDDRCYEEGLRNQNGRTIPDSRQFAEIARSRSVIPVVRKFLADGETPIGIYRKLARDRPGTFLLESAEHGRVWSRYSFIGVRCPAMLTEADGSARWVGHPPAGVVHHGDPFEAVRGTLSRLHTDRLPGLPPLTSGLVGSISYDAVRRWERLPESKPDELGLPEVALLLVGDLAVLDHDDGSVLLVANVYLDGTDPDQVVDGHADACRRLDAMQAALGAPSPSTVARYDNDASAEFVSRTRRPDYLAAVEAAKEHIRAGDAFQIVVSQRFEMEAGANALDIYRVLRVNNPSPYMFLFRFPESDPPESDPPESDRRGSDRLAGPHFGSRVDFELVGSSPEALVKLDGGRAMLHPIAGTRPRGATAGEDGSLADELLADEKERAEHLMLVDLGRNDLGRVCVPGSVEVIDFMDIERYSHVMHIVSTVVGELAPGRTAADLLAAAFPAGTLSGAPKPMAMRIIEDLEPSRRGPYGGVVGYLDFAGDLDTAICIRTAILRDGRAFVQAGAGVVADSDPASEDEECRRKAAAVLRAIAAAGTLASG